MDFKLLVLASPRSATRYLRNVLRSAKVQVGHENLKEDGGITMFYAVEDFWYPGKHYIEPHNDEHSQRRSLHNFKEVWHQTRDPRCVVPSLAAKLPPSIWHWQEKHTGISGDLEIVLRSMLFWGAWNKLIEDNSPSYRYRVENIDAEWPGLASRLGLRDVPLPNVPRTMGTSGAEPMTWADFESVDRDASELLREVAQRYGYE